MEFLELGSVIDIDTGFYRIARRAGDAFEVEEYEMLPDETGRRRDEQGNAVNEIEPHANKVLTMAQLEKAASSFAGKEIKFDYICSIYNL